MINKAESVRRFSVYHVACQDHFHGSALADEPRQTLRSAAAAHDAQIYLRLRKTRFSAADSEIASHCKLIAAAETKSVDHSDHRFWKGIDTIKKRLFVKKITLRDRRLALEFADVRTGDKRSFARTCYYENLDRIINAKLVESGDSLGVNLFIESI